MLVKAIWAVPAVLSKDLRSGEATSQKGAVFDGGDLHQRGIIMQGDIVGIEVGHIGNAHRERWRSALLRA